MQSVEICLESQDLDCLSVNVSSVQQSKAARIELCQNMSVGGLTPTLKAVQCARSLFKRQGLLVMVRPRSGDFCYTEREIDLMKSQIHDISHVNADGVVFGALNPCGKSLNEKVLSDLVEYSKKLGLETTIHRSIDCVENRKVAFETLISLGVNRVLTSGGVWGDSRTALDTIESLQQTLTWVDNKLEIVIGGGVSPRNANDIVFNAIQKSQNFSLHAYSSVLKNGVVNQNLIDALADV